MNDVVGPDEVTGEWMTEVLARSEPDGAAANGARVVAVRPSAIGTGQVGTNVRFELAWDSSDVVPATVVGKFPSTEQTSRDAARATRAYSTETGFLADVAPRSEIASPRTHHVSYDAESDQFTVIMEDYANYEVGDQLRATTPDAARASVRAIAALHADTWSMPKWVERLGWVVQPTAAAAAERATLIEALWEPFVATYQDRLESQTIDIGRQLLSNLVRLYEAQYDGRCPIALAHGDFRLDNLLFGPDGEVVVVDWQTVRGGLGPTDVAYFCGAGLVPELRAEHEESLVIDYVAELDRRDVKVSDDLVWDRYVLGSASGFLMAVVASQLVERTDRGDDMFVAMAERHAAQMDHVGLLRRLATRRSTV